MGEELLRGPGSSTSERVEVPSRWEFADPDAYARALASTGPAYEAIQTVGEEAFAAYAEELARERVRAGLPLRAEIAVVGYLARTPVAATPVRSFLREPEPTPEVRRLYDGDVDDLGYVMNASRVWAHVPGAHEVLFDLMGRAVRAGALTFRQRGILVAACASTLGDSYCSLAWGTKLAGEADPELAAGVLRGDDAGLDAQERALARWARAVARDPNGTTAADVAALREAGLDDAQVVAVTLFVAARLAFSTVNDALGAAPDRELTERAPARSGPPSPSGGPRGPDRPGSTIRSTTSADPSRSARVSPVPRNP